MGKSVLGWVLVTLLLFLLLHYRFVHIDHSQVPAMGYVTEMAYEPYYSALPPFSYRVLVPLICNLSGYVPKPGKAAVPLLGALFMSLAFAAFLKANGLDDFTCLWGVLLLASSEGILDILKEFGILNVDATSHIFIICALIGMIQGNDSLFSLSTLLGCLNREWALVLIPGWYLYHFGFRVTRLSLARCIRVTLPSVFAYYMLVTFYFPNTVIGVISRELQPLFPRSSSSHAAYYFNETNHLGLRFMLSSFLSLNFFRGALVCLWPYALLGFRFVDSSWQRFCIYYTVPCLLQLFIAADVWRLSFYLFPVVLFLTCYWLISVGRSLGNNSKVVIGFLLLPQFYLSINPSLSLTMNILFVILVEWMKRRFALSAILSSSNTTTESNFGNSSPKSGKSTINQP